VGGVWIGAVVLALVVLGFCAYEITWKAQRVQRDLARLTGLNEELAALQREVRVVQRRIADAAAESTG
jgi:hypothetical protein